MILHAYTDGAARGNPGDAGVGVIVRTDEGTEYLRLHGYIGKATNNVAEYTALVALLRILSAVSCTRLVIHSDSELMVRQINGQYRVRDRALRKHYAQAVKLLGQMPCTCEVRHIPREQNRDADRLANMGIDSRQRLVIPPPASRTQVF